MDRQQILARIDTLHNEGEHQKIIALIESVPPHEMDYELTGLLARAYINYAQPQMDSFRDLLSHAVELLRGVEAEGLSDPVWYYRLGSGLYWLDNEEEALVYLRQAQALSPNMEGISDLIDACNRAIERRTIVRPVTLDSLVKYFNAREWSFDIEDDVLRTGFTSGFYVFRIDEQHQDIGLWGAIREDVSMELRPRLIDACNTWNASTKWPKTYLSTLDNGLVRVCAEQYVTARFGMTDAMLASNINRFIEAAEEFFKEQIERFPALGGAQD